MHKAIKVLKAFLFGSSDALRKLCSAGKRSGSGIWFICAKAKRQRHMVYLRESEAAAAYVFCAKA